MREVVDTIPKLEHLRTRYDPYTDEESKTRDKLYDLLENWFVINSLKKIRKTTMIKIQANTTSQKKRPYEIEIDSSIDSPVAKKTKRTGLRCRGPPST